MCTRLFVGFDTLPQSKAMARDYLSALESDETDEEVDPQAQLKAAKRVMQASKAVTSDLSNMALHREAARAMVDYFSLVGVSSRELPYKRPEDKVDTSTYITVIVPNGENAKKWQSRLASYLKAQAMPIRLSVHGGHYSVGLQAPHHGMGVNAPAPTMFGNGLSSDVFLTLAPQFAIMDEPYYLIGHELFHVEQLQGRLQKSDLHWPSHRIHLAAETLTSEDQQTLKTYIGGHGKGQGFYMIEEVAAYLQTAITIWAYHEFEGLGEIPHGDKMIHWREYAAHYARISKLMAERALPLYDNLIQEVEGTEDIFPEMRENKLIWLDLEEHGKFSFMPALDQPIQAQLLSECKRVREWLQRFLEFYERNPQLLN